MMVVSGKGVASPVHHSIPDHVHMTDSGSSLWCMVPWARCQGSAEFTFVVREVECDWAEVQ